MWNRIKKWLPLLLLPLSLLPFPSTGQVENRAFDKLLTTLLSHSVPELSVKQLAGRSDVMLLDSREPREYEVSHLPGARLVGFDHFDIQQVADLPKNTPLVVYCTVGYRSEKIAERLLAAGFTEVYNLYGGIFEWKNQGMPVYSDKGETSQVHAYSPSWGIWLSEGEKVY